MRLILVCISIAINVVNSIQAMPPPGYTLVFDEKFDGALSISNWGSPDAKWMAHTPYAGDFGDAWFTGLNEPGISSPFSASEGILTIKAYKDSKNKNHWRSGLLSSVDTHGKGFSVALGDFECRMLHGSHGRRRAVMGRRATRCRGDLERQVCTFQQIAGFHVHVHGCRADLCLLRNREREGRKSCAVGAR